jgi:hypothetical protein
MSSSRFLQITRNWADHPCITFVSNWAAGFKLILMEDIILGFQQHLNLDASQELFACATHLRFSKDLVVRFQKCETKSFM